MTCCMDLTPTAVITRRYDDLEADAFIEFVVTVFYHGANVDRPRGCGYITRNERTAKRMARCINDGVALEGQQVKTDVFGKTYVSDRCRVYWKHANADLKRLGY